MYSSDLLNLMLNFSHMPIPRNKWFSCEIRWY